MSSFTSVASKSQRAGAEDACMAYSASLAVQLNLNGPSVHNLLLYYSTNMFALLDRELTADFLEATARNIRTGEDTKQLQLDIFDKLAAIHDALYSDHVKQ